RANAAAPGGAEAREVGPGRRLQKLHGVDVDLELLGEDHRQRGPNALPHLGLADGQDDLPRGVDADPGVRTEDGVGYGGGNRSRRTCRALRPEEADAEHEAAGRRGRDAQEVAASTSATGRQDAPSALMTTPTIVHLPPSFSRET